MAPAKKKKKVGVPVAYLKKYYPMLETIAKSKKAERTKLINKLPKPGIQSFCEICYNVLYNSEIHKNREFHLQKLKEIPKASKSAIRYLANAPRTKDFNIKRHAMIKQSGGSIGAILAAVLPVITSLISKYV